MGSGAASFRHWATHENLIVSLPVEQIKNIRIGIDAEGYLELLMIDKVHEPLLPVLGGLPFTLLGLVDRDLQRFREAGIEPIFVFSGLDLACRDKTSILKESRYATNLLSEAWNVYDQGKGNEAVTAFGRVGYRTHHIVRSLQFYLHSQGVKTQIAPYAAAAQLVYLENAQYVDAIAGWASCLIHGAEKVITGFDWPNQMFSSVALAKCLAKPGLSREQFINLCLLSGSSILAAMPELDVDTPKMQAARSMMHRAGYDVNHILPDGKDDYYRSLYQKARFALRHPVILNEDGKVEQQNWEKGPSDTHEFIGQRLPEEIYFYLSRNIIGSRVLNWRTRMEIVEIPPLDGGASQTYKDLVQDKLRPLRTKALALMTHSLNRYYQKQDVDLVCWWNDRIMTPLGIPDETEPTKAANSWHVKTKLLSPSADPNTLTPPLWYAISSLSKDVDVKTTVTPRSPGSGPQIDHLDDVRANTVWRFLQDRGYINSDHSLSAWGKALIVAFERAIEEGFMSDEALSTEIEEAIFIAFELLRLDLLNTKPLFPLPAYSGAPMRGTEADQSNTRLLGRIACLGKFHHKNIGYTGPLSRHLLAYHQSAAAVRDALRDLLEMHACNMFLSGAVDRQALKTTEFTDLGASLPFVDEPDLGLALLVMSHLEELSNEASKRGDITKWFSHALDIRGDLEKAWKMFDVVNAGVQAGDGSVINAETKQMFEDADEWLTKKRKQGTTPNGTA